MMSKLQIQSPSRWILILVFVVSLIVLFIPKITFANGGDQRVVQGKYLINLSRSPFTPKAGDSVAMIASFFDIQKDQLIAEELMVKIRIARLGEGRERKFLYEENNVRVKGGIYEFQYTFKDTGLHEIFFDFGFASNLQKEYNAPDFLLDIQKTSSQEIPSLNLYLGITMGAILGFVGAWFIRRSS